MYHHVYLHCTGLDTDFIFNPIGEKAKRLHQFIWNDNVNSALESAVDKFSEIIQSGNLSSYTSRQKMLLMIVGYAPPVPVVPLLYVGSGFTNCAISTSAHGDTLDEFIRQSNGIAQIQNNDNSCMARAIAVGYCYAVHMVQNTTEVRI